MSGYDYDQAPEQEVPPTMIELVIIGLLIAVVFSISAARQIKEAFSRR